MPQIKDIYLFKSQDRGDELFYAQINKNSFSVKIRQLITGETGVLDLGIFQAEEQRGNIVNYTTLIQKEKEKIINAKTTKVRTK